MRIRKWDVACHSKFTFFHSHADFFPESFGEVDDEQGERFHQDIKSMEHRFQGLRNDCVMADYCWVLYRDAPDIEYHKKKKSYHVFNFYFQ
jgi:hypothetical protein